MDSEHSDIAMTKEHKYFLQQEKSSEAASHFHWSLLENFITTSLWSTLTEQMRTQETREPESQPLESFPVCCVCFEERIYRATL